MELKLNSRPSTYGATIGSLQVDGVHLVDTLEDEVREVPGQPVSTWKVQDKTAIPSGRYRITLVNSPKFGPDTLSLLEVPGYMYVRVHAGNTPEDTDGCILVGMRHESGKVFDSRIALEKVKAVVVPAIKRGEAVWLTVVRNVKAADQSTGEALDI